MTNVTIDVYTKPVCQQCKATYRQLDSNSIAYEITDLTQNPAALEEAKSLGHLSAPVVIVRDANGIVDHWSGFQPDKIKSLVTA